MDIQEHIIEDDLFVVGAQAQKALYKGKPVKPTGALRYYDNSEESEVVFSDGSQGFVKVSDLENFGR